MGMFNKTSKKEPGNPEAVAAYYDKYTRGYLDTYGDTIQAFRPEQVEDLHRYVMGSAGIRDGMRVLDAGCGVAGPACYFASHADLTLDGITISAEQKRLADARIREQGLGDRVHIIQGDYHQLSDHFAPDTYDLVLFLESLGHAADACKVLDETWQVLAPGGCVYIKDFFPFDIVDAEKALRHQFVIDRINESYTYNVLSLDKTLRKLRQTGFELLYVKKFDFVDDITARFQFEEMFRIDLFGDMEEFRVAEWLELKFRKPETPLF